MIALIIIIGILLFLVLALPLYLLVVSNKRAEEALQRGKEAKINYEELNKFFKEERKDD